MQLNTLQPNHPGRRSREVGRGGKRGKTSGRGTKGQKARAGHKMRPELRDIIKKIPKLRGYRFHGITEKPFALSLLTVAAAFENGATITPKTLRTRGLIRENIKNIKILGSSKLNKKLTIKGMAVSGSARAVIEKAGGTIEAK
ncbi:50S ribosomal protein L15 [Candidatus Kaiserbacteria bacterium RIFCSPHIGHO2_01_FULL_49_13]|uniref:Large ribosomal subunit protein uL15 n=1 Tax=Candidatus Kaiserbacteria bacterium RIFCSPHIGHO2_01_FULL_49_13 TaxID=1798477 RepID=A0A1F6CF08_9BACT|nr:MAG: 50S ribosomal protein L15 [Candidatus Kaiserbacteria bacterium RIFCSPHIGHO2_01_FULL_49_13]